jgi:hypothetical protein
LRRDRPARKNGAPWHIGVQGALLDYFCCDSGPPTNNLLGAKYARAPPLELDVVFVAVVATMGMWCALRCGQLKLHFF